MAAMVAVAGLAAAAAHAAARAAALLPTTAASASSLSGGVAALDLLMNDPALAHEPATLTAGGRAVVRGLTARPELNGSLARPSARRHMHTVNSEAHGDCTCSGSAASAEAGRCGRE